MINEIELIFIKEMFILIILGLLNRYNRIIQSIYHDESKRSASKAIVISQDSSNLILDYNHDVQKAVIAFHYQNFGDIICFVSKA
jgi:hypothetical protein